MPPGRTHTHNDLGFGRENFVGAAILTDTLGRRKSTYRNLEARAFRVETNRAAREVMHAPDNNSDSL